MLRWWRATSSTRDFSVTNEEEMNAASLAKKKNVDAASLATLEGEKECHALELSVSLSLLVRKRCHCITWILCPNAMLLSADTSWIRWVCPSILKKRTPSVAFHISATWGTNLWRERTFFVVVIDWNNKTLAKLPVLFRPYKINLK